MGAADLPSPASNPRVMKSIFLIAVSRYNDYWIQNHPGNRSCNDNAVRTAVIQRSPTMANRVDESVKALIQERDELKQHCTRLQNLLSAMSYPPGHFYSPLVDPADPHAISAVRNRTTAPLPQGIAVDSAQMLETMFRLSRHHRQFPFPREKRDEWRYCFNNPFFGCHDAGILFAMMLEFRPRRIVEVGCGHSSRLLLDTNEHFFGGEIDITMIDPYVESDLRRHLQDAPPELFTALEANDILFIDSSHVAKTGSDVNHYMFQILPRVRPGVLIHIHDILYPFEYPEDWVVDEKRSWNEAYLVQAFLQYNTAFEILYWANYAWHFHAEELARLMPLCMENEGGSLWLKKK